jgi:hypothetical protein
MWLKLLRRAVAASSRQQVADEIGMSRPTVSLVMAGKYPAKTDKIERKVMTRYGRVQCPFLETEIGFADCREHHERDAPTSSPYAMRHWRACQNCPHRKEAQ